MYHSLSHFRPALDAAGVPVHVLAGSGGRDPRVLVALARLLARGRYDIVHSYLRTPGTLARLAAPFSRGTRVVVSERNVDLGRSRTRVAIERLLSRRAERDDRQCVRDSERGREARAIVGRAHLCRAERRGVERAHGRRALGGAGVPRATRRGRGRSARRRGQGRTAEGARPACWMRSNSSRSRSGAGSGSCGSGRA